MIIFLEIRKCKNGYMIFDESRYVNGGIQSAPWVFETLENALNFIRETFRETERNEDKAPEQL